MAEGPLDIALRVVGILDELGIAYVLGGSLASSLVGEPRATADVDLAIRIAEESVAPLVRALEFEFYVSEAAARDAVQRHASFNLVHLETVLKVDLFVLGDGRLDRRQLEGRTRVLGSENPPRELWVGSAEDQILRKLSCYRGPAAWKAVSAIVHLCPATSRGVHAVDQLGISYWVSSSTTPSGAPTYAKVMSGVSTG